MPVPRPLIDVAKKIEAAIITIVGPRAARQRGDIAPAHCADDGNRRRQHEHLLEIPRKNACGRWRNDQERAHEKHPKISQTESDGEAERE